MHTIEMPKPLTPIPASSKATTDAAVTNATPAAMQPAPTGPIRLGSPIVPTQTLTLLLSEDAYRGNAQFIVLMDGKQIVGPAQVTGLHGSAQTEAFNLLGDWGAGPHTLAIDFINDAYGGTRATDRNLYVNQITYNGTNTLESTAVLYRNGAMTWTIGAN